MSRRGVLKVNIRKAFDTVGGDNILEVLVVVDVLSKYVNWTKQCITNSSFSLNINGSLCGYFKGTKGPRHGDPLFLSLFVIVMELLSHLLEAKFANGLTYHLKAKYMRILSLAFADELMIFYDGKPYSLLAITVVLDDFKMLSELEMNRRSLEYTLHDLIHLRQKRLQLLGLLMAHSLSDISVCRCCREKFAKLITPFLLIKSALDLIIR